MPCARLSWPSRQLLSARKYIVSYRVVSYCLQAELHQQREDLHSHHHHHHHQQHQQMRASWSSHSSDSGIERRHGAGKLASSVSTSSAATAPTNSSSPAGSPLTRRTGPRILPSILGRFTSHRSASSDRLKRNSGQRRTESSENINISLSSSPGSPASVGAPSSPSRPWESRLMVWDSRSALSPSQDDTSTISQASDASPVDGDPVAGDDDAATSPASTGPSSDGSCRLQPWRTDVMHQQQQQPEWMLDMTSSGQNSRRSSTATVNSDAPNP